MAALKAKRLVVGTFDGVRILGDGELTKKLTVKANHFSKSAEGEDREGRRHLRADRRAEEAGAEQDGIEEEGDPGRGRQEGSQDLVN